MTEKSQTGSRVLQVVRPAAGGMRRHVSILCRGLSERGIRVRVAAPRGFTLEGADPAPVRTVPISARHHLVQDVRAAIAVSRLAHHSDLIHGHGMRGAWICALAARRARKPVILTAHNLAPAANGQLAPRLIRATVNGAGARIAVSHAVADSFVEFGVDSDFWHVIPNGVELAAFDNPPDRASVLRSLGVDPNGMIILGAGRLAPEKGFDRLVESAHTVLDGNPSAWFVLAGDGPERAKLEEMAEPLGDRFILAGAYEAIYGLLSASDIVAVPSIQEGQGIVALEAMAAGKPVVASRVGGLVETIVDGETGLLVPEADPSAFAEALIALLADSASRARLGAAGRKRAGETYTVSRMVDATVDVYSGVL